MSHPGNGDLRDYQGLISAGGASLVQVETLGAKGVLALWVSSFLAAGSLIAVIAMCFWIDRLSARVYVLEYDMSHVCAQLINKEIIEVCH